jgi:3-deoxy-D-manno-octulosonic-acid transferase
LESQGKAMDNRKKEFSDINTENSTGKNTIWMHCASLGEFEQEAVMKT